MTANAPEGSETDAPVGRAGRLARVLKLRERHAIVVLLIAGIFMVVLTFSTLNLLRVGLANLEFIREYGWVAIMEGALVQLLGIIGASTIALLSYMGFKLCEHELARKYEAWQDR